MSSAPTHAAVTITAMLLASTIAAVGPVEAQIVLDKTESKCSSKLGKSGAKLAKTVLKELTKCRDGEIAGKVAGPCPTTSNLAKIGKIGGKVVASAVKSCKSVCSASQDVECIADELCPPIVSVSSGSPQFCSAGAKNQPFDMGSLGFPGAFCEDAVGGSLTVPEDIGECVRSLTFDAANVLIDVIYGSVDNGTGISPGAASCLRSIAKATTKLTLGVQKGVAKCRDAIRKGKTVGEVANCQTEDDKVVLKTGKFEDKLESTIDSACTDGQIQELDLCNNGIGLTPDRDAAKLCLVDAAREVADSPVVTALRTYAPISLIDAAYPPPARCGDNVVNQIPNAFLLLGEQCDGDDDAACPGQCLPPGDVFECTCGDVPRIRLFGDQIATDADAGWTGVSHDQGVADQSGFVTELSNCDCDQFTGPTCTGASGDSVCDAGATTLPFCSWDLFSGTPCDAHGTDPDSVNGNNDCFICDDFSANAGDFCVDERDCDAQCYDSAGTPTGPCENQADCAAGEVCRGQCDRSQTCVITPNGAPLPVAAAGTSVCAVQRFRTDISGTRNVITGEHELNFSLFSRIHLGERTTRPCPVCGGFCEGGPNDLEVCEGRCTVSGDPCRFDSDCGVGEACSTATPDCPGGFCQLAQVCGTNRENGSLFGKACTIEYVHPAFGAMSNDCLPANQSINGQGFIVDNLPGTTDLLSLPAALPCTASGFELLSCPCPDGGGQPTKPNGCVPACDAGGPQFGQGCAIDVPGGAGTTCDSGPNVGKLCDEDSDCTPGTCSANPTHCEGDPAFEQFSCDTNADCGVGECVDACTGGRCLPLCIPQAGTDFDGVCAAGPKVTHCSTPKFSARTCPLSAAEAGCSATCSVSATPCMGDSECPSGESCTGACPVAASCEAGDDGVLGNSDDLPGYGICVADDLECYLDPIVAEGGSTVNGKGDPENDLHAAVFCYSATTNPGVNASAGFGGPGRVLYEGINVTNGFTSIP